jgi:UDP-3-O-[3-hydroxymyristoyl] glucosamine N-acyltransferase
MITINDILKKIPVVQVIGNKDHAITALVKTEDVNADSGNLCWCSDKNIHLLKDIQKGSVICSTSVSKELMSNSACNYIVVENPRLAFKQVIEHFFAEKDISYEIQPSAFVHSSAKLAGRVKLGHNVVIAEDVEIGDGSVIGSNTVILKGTRIGQRVKIGCNNTIGGVGFGYEKNEKNEYELIPHIGNVIIEDDVEVGNNVAIDRAVLGSTILKKNVKVDNLVHIAHGADIGEGSLIIANSMIAGSVTVGKNVWVAPSASVMNKRSIGDNAVIGMGAVVLKDVKTGEVIIGNPGKTLNKND